MRWTWATSAILRNSDSRNMCVSSSWFEFLFRHCSLRWAHPSPSKPPGPLGPSGDWAAPSSVFDAFREKGCMVGCVRLPVWGSWGENAVLPKSSGSGVLDGDNIAALVVATAFSNCWHLAWYTAAAAVAASLCLVRRSTCLFWSSMPSRDAREISSAKSSSSMSMTDRCSPSSICRTISFCSSMDFSNSDRSFSNFSNSLRKVSLTKSLYAMICSLRLARAPSRRSSFAIALRLWLSRFLFCWDLLFGLGDLANLVDAHGVLQRLRNRQSRIGRQQGRQCSLRIHRRCSRWRWPRQWHGFVGWKGGFVSWPFGLRLGLLHILSTLWLLRLALLGAMLATFWSTIAATFATLAASLPHLPAALVPFHPSLDLLQKPVGNGGFPANPQQRGHGG